MNARHRPQPIAVGGPGHTPPTNRTGSTCQRAAPRTRLGSPWVRLASGGCAPQAVGLAVPETLLATADEVIE